MKEHSIHEDPKIAAFAERQMRDWAIAQEIVERAREAGSLAEAAAQVRRYVSISREAGAGGAEVARLVADKLGWQLFDRNLLDRVAERFHHCRMMLELVDETESNWVYDVLGTWMDRQIVPHEKYVSQLARIVLAAARGAHCVFVGRGAQFMLPRDRGLAVRLVAPERFRVERIMRLEGRSAADARQRVEQLDRGRAEFVERFFHHAVADPHLYDLVINTERWGMEGAAEQIAAAARG